MNRADAVRTALVWDQVAAEAGRRAADAREQLAVEARAELTEQGTAPTWRMPGVATVSLSVSKQAIDVSDPAALLEWAKVNHPSEVETVVTTRVRPSFITALSRLVVAEGELAVEKETGAIVPGLTVKPGGRPGSISIRAEAGVKAVSAGAAAEVIEQIAGVFGHVAIAAAPAVDDVWSAAGDPFAIFPPAANEVPS